LKTLTGFFLHLLLETDSAGRADHGPFRQTAGMASRPVRLLILPYDSGKRDVRMGAGPLALMRSGATDILRSQGHRVQQQQLEPSSEWQAELRTAFELQRQVAIAATEAHRSREIPLLLSGNCNATIGMLAGLADSRCRVGLVWFDAHGDFNTPETDPFGFLDGQALAMAVGRCWRALTTTVPGFTPLPEPRVLLVGARSLDDAEELALRGSEIEWLTPTGVRTRGAMRAAVDRLAAESDVVHIHVDLDVHDSSVGFANAWAAPDAPTAEQVRSCIGEVANRLPISSATLASYDPSCDSDGRMNQIALRLLALLADSATPAEGTR
jgi:arginase